MLRIQSTHAGDKRFFRRRETTRKLVVRIRNNTVDISDTDKEEGGFSEFNNDRIYEEGDKRKETAHNLRNDFVLMSGGLICFYSLSNLVDI